MFKKLLVAMMLVLPFAVSAQTIKIGLVDSQTVMLAMPEYKTAETELQTLQTKYEGEYKKLETEYNRMLEELNKLPEDTPSAILEQKQQALVSYQTTIRQFLTNADTEIQKKQTELMTPIVQRINTAIQAVGVEGEYTLISEKSVALYYSGATTDITDLIKAKLDIK